VNPGAERSVVPFLAFFRRRGLPLFVGSTLYAGVAAIRSNAEEPRLAWFAGFLGLVLSILATRRSLSPAELDRGEGGRSLDATAYATWGLALAVVSLSGGSRWVESLGIVGVSVAAAAACLAPRSAPRALGVASSLPVPRGAVTELALALLALLPIVAAGVCLSSDVALALGGREALAGWFGTTSAVLALLILVGVVVDRLRAERLILGAGERARAALGALLGVFGIAVAILVTRAASPTPVLRLGAALAAVLAAVAFPYRDAAFLARIGRRALALLLFGGPVVLLSAISAEGYGSGTTAALVGGVVALGVGTLGAWLERPLRPAEGRWLDAMALAEGALARADPETSVDRALAALRAAAGTAAESPELWSLEPTRVVTIDAAGYTREREGALPPLLLSLAAGEPEATLRTELLEALLVRRPDLRALARWMDERGALTATLVTREGETTGVLVVPRGSRRDPVTLEEAVALKRLADAMSGACAQKSAFARSLLREREATLRAEAAEHHLARYEHTGALAAERALRKNAVLVEGVDVGRYSPTMRLAAEALERRASVRAPIVLVAPTGLDPVAYLAAAHVHAGHGSAPFVVVDAAASAERDPDGWRDKSRSPLALAQGGMLVLLDGGALPVSVQALIGAALSERRAPWEDAEPLDIAIALTTPVRLGELTRAQRLDPVFQARFGDANEAEIVLPALCDRPEDLRALLCDRLAREGLRRRGAPLGIEDAAFALLAEHPFPGDHAELVLIARRLAASASGDVVRAEDVLDLGLVKEAGPRVNVRGSQSVS
jgi:transcriptional regulator with AAA-type ATPase domain